MDTELFFGVEVGLFERIPTEDEKIHHYTCMVWFESDEGDGEGEPRGRMK